MSSAFGNILYPTDFSEVSLAAAPYAQELTRRYDARLHCIHVVDDAYQYWGALGPESIPVGPPPGEILTLAEQRMSAMCDETFEGINAVTTKVVQGRPFSAIIAYAREEHIDLIVMATHGRGAVAHMLLGSTAELVVRKAPCAVLTVRWKEHRFELP